MLVETLIVVVCLQPLCFSMCGYGTHIREGVKEHDRHYGPKFYQLKLLGNLVIQQPLLPSAIRTKERLIFRFILMCFSVFSFFLNRK